MNVLVVGAGGFIGKHLVARLKKDGHSVVEAGRYSFYQYYDGKYLNDLIRKNNFDHVYNLSAYGNMFFQKNAEETIKANITNTTNLLNWCKDSDIQAFIQVSTSAVMLNTQNMYSLTKQIGEHICHLFKKAYEMPVGIIRPMSVYGPGESDFRFIPTVFRSCLENEPMMLEPNAVHDWIYIDEFIEDMITLPELIDSNPTLQIRTSGTGILTKNSDVVTIIEKITKKKANIQERTVLRDLNWQDLDLKHLSPPKITLEQGLKKIYNSLI